MSVIGLSTPADPGGAWLRVIRAEGGWGRGSLADWPGPRLEEAVAAHVAELMRNRLEPRRLDAVLDRMGLRGRPPVTLAEAGRSAGLSGERVRQLEARLRKLHAAASPPLPALDAALEAVAREVPLRASEVAGVLQSYGLTAGTFSAESLLGAAELFGRRLPFAVAGAGADAVLLPEAAAGAASHLTVIEARARRQVERTGASTVEGLAEDLADERIRVGPDELAVVLETCAEARIRPDGWFWFAGSADGSGAFVRASRRMLAVTSPLSVESLHDGLRRHNAFRRRPAPPPVPVLADLYADHPAFELVDGLVAPIQPVDPDIVGPLNRRLIEILRSAPGGVMARTPLLAACHRAGLNLTSVNLYTTYSECLERVRPGVFAARGTQVSSPDAASAGADRRAAVRRPDDEPVCGWTADGRPWLVERVTPGTWANGVVHVPAELRTVLEDRHFECTATDGTPIWLGVDRHGNSWGWTGFLRRSGAAPGDVIRATFDPAAGTVQIDVVGGGPGERPG